MNENVENWEHSPFEELFSNAVFFFQKSLEKNEDENLYSRQAIVNSVFAIEASANCCINMLDISKPLFGDIEKLPTLSKFEFYLSQIKPLTKFDRGFTSVQKVAELIKLRHNYVHPKPIKLKGKFETVDLDSGIERVYKFQNIEKQNSTKISSITSNWDTENAKTVMITLLEFCAYFFIDLCSFSLENVSYILCTKNQLRDGSKHWIISDELKRAFAILEKHNLIKRSFMKVPVGACDILLMQEKTYQTKGNKFL